MTDVEIAVGLLITRLVRQALLDSDRADMKVNESFEVALRAVHELVVAKLGADPALERLQIEASSSGEVRPRTQARLALSLEDAVEEDAEFAKNLEHAVNDARTAGQSEVVTRGGVINQITGTVSGRVVQARDINGGVTFHDGPKGN